MQNLFKLGISRCQNCKRDYFNLFSSSILIFFYLNKKNRIWFICVSGASNAEQQEEQVERLMDMGFDRESVVNALRAANNDLNTATNLLLQEG